MSQRHVPNTFVFKQLASLRKLEELAMKFEQAQISRKLAQATASWRSNEVQASTCKLKTCDDLRSRLIRALNTDKTQPFFLLSLQIYHTHSPATMIINTRNNMPSDIIHTHPDALICHNKNGGGGPITYQIIILYINPKEPFLPNKTTERLI